MTTSSGRLRAFALAPLAAVALACGGEDRKSDEPATSDPAAAATPSATPPATPAATPSEPADAAMRTTDGNVEMALRGDRVQIGLSEQVLAKVHEKLGADSAGSSSGLGGMIKGIVSSSVQGALATRMDYPLDEIEEISYDGQRLRLVQRGKGPQMEHANVNDRPLLESFPPDDARRFVDAVRAAKARRGEGR